MSDSNTKLPNGDNLATEQRSRTSGSTVYLEEFQKVAPISLGQAPMPFVRQFASGVGVDLATTADDYDLTPASGEILRVMQVSLTMRCSSAGDFSLFGNIAAIATGLKLELLDSLDAVITDVLGGSLPKRNDELAAMFDVEISTAGATFLVTASLALAGPIRLHGVDGEKLRLTVADDLSSLSYATLTAIGVEESAIR